ncbi:rho guanine nucleotide exchange factor 17 isoform X4 [Ceratina calcarata]|uniref:Rho guanine nucleotide exchange factor 17 isoform X4 n=1 Tax=Ceratina calcarata TaxID=156304 RepID=A0AAJ7RWL0_9HYME|nr:rho guanine nucleotide exchange factor 17 isoform X4 [Ceratina calcarata]
MEREHKGKLGLDQLLIKPVQKIPRYELLIQRLLKHTDSTHPDFELLQAALKEVHELVVKINCTERESLEWEQQQTTLREVQALVEGLDGIVTNDRAFVRHDLVTIASNQGTRKERALFLFSDLLVITRIKRRSGTIRKPSTSCPNSLVGLLEANKYKMIMRIPLDDVEVMKAKDENLRRMAREVDHLREDCATLTQLQELAATLHGAKQQLEDLIKDMLGQAQRQLAERNAAHSQLACLELTLNTQTGIENISVMFAKPDERANWEESLNEAKQKLALSADRRPCPEFAGPLPVRKTRAGLQFTCAAPTLTNGQGSRDVWVCNSDGYVGQVCVLSLTPEPPQVTSCNGVCNARILCVAGIPACTQRSNSCVTNNVSFANSKSGISISVQDVDASGRNIQLDSSSSSDESDSDDIPCADTGSLTLGGDVPSIDNVTTEEDVNQATMWLGTEDGCIHVYNCNDNIRTKKNKIKIQHNSSVHCIIYLDNKVFVSLANGDIAVYTRDHMGGWNTPVSTTVSVGTVATPVTKMLPVSGKIWCGCHNSVKILNTQVLDIEHSFAVSEDTSLTVSCMASSGGLGVWISLHISAVLRLFHSASYECLTDINIAPAVTKMLTTGCDVIIRQHKAALLRVTALLACNELLWIGTSAGVLLTVPIPHIKPSTQRMSQPPIVTGIPHGHTGHVRFLTCVETTTPSKPDPRPNSLKSSKNQQNNISRGKLLVISGGDGYEDFRGPQASAELQAGREDSTNHLLLWKV